MDLCDGTRAHTNEVWRTSVGSICWSAPEETMTFSSTATIPRLSTGSGQARTLLSSRVLSRAEP